MEAATPKKTTIAATLVGLALVGAVGVAAVLRSEPTLPPPSTFLRDLDASLMVEGDAGAWPLYQRALFELQPCPSKALRDAIPGGPNWPTWEAHVRRNQALIAVLVEASRRPHFGAPLGKVRYHQSWVEFHRAHGDRKQRAKHERERDAASSHRDDAFHVRPVSLVEMRDLGKLLVVAARQHAHEGRRDEALELVQALSDMGGQIGRGRTFIDAVVGACLQMMATTELRELLIRHAAAWTDGELQRVVESPMLTRPLPSAVEVFRVEWEATLDFVGDLFTLEPDGDGELHRERAAEYFGTGPLVPWRQAAHRLGLAMHVGRRETLEVFERMHLLAQEVLAGTRERSELDQLRAQLGETRFGLVHVLNPGYHLLQAAVNLEDIRVQRDAARATVALVRYLGRHGEWPSDVNLLVPDLLDALPLDFDGDPLGFVPAQNGVLPAWQSRKFELKENW